MEEKSPQISLENVQDSLTQVKKKNNKKVWIVIATLPVLVILCSILFFFFTKPQTISGTRDRLVPPQEPTTIPEPTPFAFAELTIPYLRAKTYTSSLSELYQVSSNASYTSYLTSYSSDGFKINGQLTKPVGEMPAGGWPAIIFVHGYIPPRSYQTLVNYSSYVDY
jgi:hypothetical protein